MGRFFLFLLISCISLDAGAQSPRRLGKVTSPYLQEISGIVPSSFHAGAFWVHNDSGNRSEIYLIDSLCSLLQTVYFEGVDFKDVEDVARLTVEGEPWLLLADIGDNLRVRDTLVLYLFKEPKAKSSVCMDTLFQKDIHRVYITYGDKRRDAEAIFVDPWDQQVYVISKRDFKSQVFRLSLDLRAKEVLTLQPVCHVPFNFVTSADISSDGSQILIKNLTHVYRWNRKKGESMISALSQKPQVLPYDVEPQGEAICLNINGSFFYTISERPLGLDSYLYQYHNE